MPRDPNIRALAACGMQVLQATNGHGRRWAAARCVRQLVALGTPAGIAERSALAMVVVAQAIQALAALARTEAAGVARLPEHALPAGWKYGTRTTFAPDQLVPAVAAGRVKVKFSSRVEFPPSLPSGQPHPQAAEPSSGPVPHS